LMDIPYISLTIAHVAFNKADINIGKGMSYLIPRCEGINTLFIIRNSACFEGRCPKGEELISCFLGGATSPDIIDTNDDDIKNMILKDLNKVMKITAKPKFIYIKRWRQVIPQFVAGHASKVKDINTVMRRQDGIFLTGGYLTGFSLPDTIMDAKNVTEKIMRYFG